jgi:transcriptional regulator with XRE-family HTH domain
MKLVIGKKIKAMRLTSDLTQEELANRSGLSKGFISQLENDQTSVQIDTLADILEALGTTIAEFFTENGEQRAVFRPSERVSVDGTGATSLELLVPGSTNKVMDPILVRLEAGESLAKQAPHPGEQFGFVTQGTVTLRLGKKKHRVPKGHCFYFESDCEHQFENRSDRTAELLWITTPPQM